MEKVVISITMTAGSAAKGRISEVTKVQGVSLAVRGVSTLPSRTSKNIQTTPVSLYTLFIGDAYSGLAGDLKHPLPEVEALHPHAVALWLPCQD